jgi:hypothetical protein
MSDTGLIPIEGGRRALERALLEAIFRGERPQELADRLKPRRIGELPYGLPQGRQR